MTFFRKLLLIWMILWLPAAGALAAIMPLSGSINVIVTIGSDAANDQGIAEMPCHGKAASGKTAFGQGCTHCVLCHLAGALVVPQMPIIPTLPPTHIFNASPLVALPSFVPELISPPPRAFAI